MIPVDETSPIARVLYQGITDANCRVILCCEAASRHTPHNIAYLMRCATMPDRFVIPAITLAALLLSMPHASSAERSDKHGTLRGDATKGRDLFNGQGICHYCHGVDGFLDRLPTLAPDTKAVIDRLSPPPPRISANPTSFISKMTRPDSALFVRVILEARCFRTGR